MNDNFTDVKSYTFDHGGDAYQATNSPTINLFAKKKSEEYFGAHLFNPLDFEDKQEFDNTVCNELEVTSIDEVDFEVSDSDLADDLYDLFFADGTDVPKDALFDYAKLTPHAQDVVNCYAKGFSVSDDTPFLQLLEKIRELYVGKYTDDEEFAENELDNGVFGIQVPDELKKYVDFEQMSEDMVRYMIVEENHYFR